MSVNQEVDPLHLFQKVYGAVGGGSIVNPQMAQADNVVASQALQGVHLLLGALDQSLTGQERHTLDFGGMNEVGLNARWLRKDLTHPETQAFAKDVLNHMRERLSDYQEQYGDLYNLEATPAESTTYRLAKHDVALYPDIITAAADRKGGL